MSGPPIVVCFCFLSVLLPIIAQNATNSSASPEFSTIATSLASTEHSSERSSTFSTSIAITTTGGPRICSASVDDPTFCAYADSPDEKCDICSGMNCTALGDHKICRQLDSKCKAICYCPFPFKEGDHGDCIGPCDQNPCKNNGVCRLGASSKREYTCACANGWEGQNCESVTNQCLQLRPPRCPKGPFQCTMLAPNNYTCDCAPGFWKDNTKNECIRVDEVASVKIHFVETPYSEIYNNASHPSAIYAKTVIKALLTKVFATRLVSYEIQNFTQGSLIANLDIFLKRKEGEETNQYSYKKHLLDCSLEDDTQSTPECGGSLGRISADIIPWNQKDEVCANVACPEYTRCEAMRGSIDDTKCSCDTGFTGTGSTLSTNGQLIENCTDRDECALSGVCSPDEVCVNLLGSHECLSPCKGIICPGYSQCVVTGTSYDCHCSWIYAGSSCTFPWTLILLIFACIFLATTILVTVLLAVTLRSGRRASYKVNIPLSTK